jgi:hypothetical protein
MAKVIFACLVTVRALSFSNKVDVIASPEHGQPAHIGYRSYFVEKRRSEVVPGMAICALPQSGPKIILMYSKRKS